MSGEGEDSSGGGIEGGDWREMDRFHLIAGGGTVG